MRVCGRFGYETPEFTEVRFQAELLPDVQPELLAPRYNIAPSEDILTVANSKRLDGRRAIKSMRWGLVSQWAYGDRKKARPINLKAEALLDNPYRRRLLNTKRCLIPAGWLYEWEHDGQGRTGQAWSLGLRSGESFAFAALWDAVKTGPGDDEWLVSAAMITTPPNDFVGQLHHRQAVILRSENEAEWLDGDTTEAELMALLAPLPSNLMDGFRVSNLVGDPRNKDPEVHRPLPTASETPT